MTDRTVRGFAAAQLSLGVVALGGTAVVVGVAVSGGSGPTPAVVPAVLAALLVVLLTWLPFSLPRSTGGVLVSFEPAVLGYLLLVTGPRAAMLIWFAGVLVGQLSYPGRRELRNRLFNVGLAPLAGGAALLVFGVLHSPALDPQPLRQLAVLSLATVAYFLVDLGLSALQVSWELGGTWFSEVRQGFVGLVLVVLVTVTAVAYLAALVTGMLPSWVLVLVVLPVLSQLYLGRVLVASNRRYWRSSRLYGAAQELAVVSSCDELEATTLRVARAVMDHGTPVLRAHGPSAQEVGARLTLNGRTRHLVVRVDHRPDSVAEDQRALAGLCALVEQAATRLALTDELQHTAHHDSLTGLANRRVLLRELTAALTLHPEPGSRGLLMVDLDDFKAINDSLGHHAGDEHLVEVARRIRAVAQPEDLVARLGGDEFAVLVRSPATDALLDTAGKVLAALVTDRAAPAVGASIGATSWRPEEDVATVLGHADVALYASKSHGKATVTEFTPALLETGARRKSMQEDLRRDLDVLQVHYQPVIELGTGRIDGCEALVRWSRDGVAVSPSEFVPLAEECGLVVELGRRVLRQVLADLPQLQAHGRRPLSVAVNVSAPQLEDPQLLELVRRGVQGCAGASFLVEMTERVLIKDDDATLAALHRLTDAGAHLVLDDFGSGYSAIGYLRRLPVDGIKLDRSVVAGVDRAPQHRRLVSGLVAMCREMGISTLAEGVETTGEHECVTELGVTLAQGFVFAPALPLPDMVDLLRTRGQDLGAPRAPVVEPAILPRWPVTSR